MRPSGILDSEIFLDEVRSSNIYTNPLLDTISADRIGDAQYLIELFFEEELDYGNLSYVMAYFPSGERIYWGSALIYWELIHVLLQQDLIFLAI